MDISQKILSDIVVYNKYAKYVDRFYDVKKDPGKCNDSCEYAKTT